MNVKVIVLILVILVTFKQTFCFNLFSKINDVIKKAKDFYKKKYHKDKTWQFLGYDKTEYPGTDQQLLNLNREKWNTYYDCLKKQEDSLENHGSIIPEAVLAFEDQLITYIVNRNFTISCCHSLCQYNFLNVLFLLAVFNQFFI